VVGELIDAKKGMILVEGGKEKELKHPIVDPFWRAFYDAMQKLNAIQLKEPFRQAQEVAIWEHFFTLRRGLYEV